MFYRADEVETALKCSFCKKKFEDAVKFVPECGCFVCGKCNDDAKDDAAETGKYKCEACQQTHLMPKDGLADCKQLLPLLKSKPLEKPLSENAKKLKTLVKEVVEQMEKLEAFDSKEVVNEHCDRLEQDIKQTVASAIEHLRTIETKLIAEISEYRTRCLDETAGSAKQDLDALSVKVQEFNTQWSRYFSQLDVFSSEADIDASLKRIDDFRAEMLTLEKRLKEEALGGQLLVFKPSLEFFQRSETIGAIVNLTPREMRIVETQTTTLAGHSSRIWTAIHLSHDRVASCSDDKTIRVWNVKESKELFKLEGHTGSVYSLATLHNDLLASGSGDTTIKIWDLEQKKEIRTLQGHTNRVVSFCLLKNGNLVSCSYDNTIRVWNPYVSENNLLLTITGHGNFVFFNSIGLLSNELLVTCSRDASGQEVGILRVWNSNNGKLIRQFSSCFRAACSLFVLRGGDRVAIGYENGSIIIVDLQNEADSVTKEQAHSSRVVALAQLSNGNLISCGIDGPKWSIKLWTLPDFGLLQTIDTGHSRNVWSLCISPDETSLSSAGKDNIIKLWPLAFTN